EADIGQVRVGQAVSFGVDAFPERQFRGTVLQLRLSATNTNNVITYPVVVSVDNADQSLLPGMTANAEIEVSRRDDVLRVSNAALRYKPAADGATAAAPRNGAGGSLAADLTRVARTLKLDARQQAEFDAALVAMRERTAARTATAAPAASSGSPLFGGGRSPGGGTSGGGNDGAMRQRMQE